MTAKPKWLILTDELLWPLVGMGLNSLNFIWASSNPDLGSIPYASLLHFAHSLETSMVTNEAGKHSVAICLLRQCVETVTLIDIGLQETTFSEPLLASWKAGKKSHGELRAKLEENIWPNYGTGFWDENWTEYFRNFAGAVQPYAHYTQGLMGWQFSVVDTNLSKSQYLASLDLLGGYDPLKASRITLFHSILGWTLGRLLLTHGKNQDVLDREDKILDWGKSLASSKLLFHKENWGVQLLADVFFKSGASYFDS
ncbi:MAG: hypothetical protein K8L91_30940 [Anaerolineae bacterium]|nr:hypothetical protein [Anaerolineae bacterium]